LPNLEYSTTEFTVHEDGAVSYLSQASGAFSRDMVVDGKIIAADNKQVTWKAGVAAGRLLLQPLPSTLWQVLTLDAHGLTSLTQVHGDRELNVVTFDRQGLVKSYCTGVVVAEGLYSKLDPNMETQINEQRQKLINQEDKLKTLVGQEGKVAYQKVR